MTLTNLAFLPSRGRVKAAVVCCFNNALIVEGFRIEKRTDGVYAVLPPGFYADMTRPEQRALSGRILATWALRKAMKEPVLNEYQEAA